MTALEIATKYVHGKNDARTDSQEIKDMVSDIIEFAQEKCKEQRVICSKKALLEVTILNTVTGQGNNIKNHLPYSNQVAETTEEIVCADKDSILNAPEPKFD